MYQKTSFTFSPQNHDYLTSQGHGHHGQHREQYFYAGWVFWCAIYLQLSNKIFSFRAWVLLFLSFRIKKSPDISNNYINRCTANNDEIISFIKREEFVYSNCL